MVDYYRKSAIQFRHFCDFVPITKLSFKKSKTKWKMYKYVNTLSWTCSNIINIIVIYEFNDITMLFTFLFHFSLTLCSNHWFSFTGMGLAHLERKFILSMWRIPHIFSLSFWYTQHTHPYTYSHWTFESREQWCWINFIFEIFLYTLSLRLYDTPIHTARK